jgi:hypothetical protein
MAGTQATQIRSIVTEPGVTSLILQPTSPTVVSINKVTAGTVIIGTQAQLAPLSQLNGIQLGNEIRYLLLMPGDVLYIFATSVEEVSIATHNLAALFTFGKQLAPAPAPVQNITQVSPGIRGPRP